MRRRKRWTLRYAASVWPRLRGTGTASRLFSIQPFSLEVPPKPRAIQ